MVGHPVAVCASDPDRKTSFELIGVRGDVIQGVAHTQVISGVRVVTVQRANFGVFKIIEHRQVACAGQVIVQIFARRARINGKLIGGGSGGRNVG